MPLRIFSGSVSVVSGGASGIGRALAEELALRGSEIILADLQTELMAEVAAGIREKGGVDLQAISYCRRFSYFQAL